MSWQQLHSVHVQALQHRPAACLHHTCVGKNQYLCHLQLSFPQVHPLLKRFLEGWESHALNHDDMIIYELRNVIGAFQNIGLCGFVKLHNEWNRFPFILYLVECLEQRNKQFNFQIQPLQMVIPASTTLLMSLSRKCQIFALGFHWKLQLCILLMTQSARAHFLCIAHKVQHLNTSAEMNTLREKKKRQFHLQACLCSGFTKAASRGLINDYD